MKTAKVSCRESKAGVRLVEPALLTPALSFTASVAPWSRVVAMLAMRRNEADGAN